LPFDDACTVDQVCDKFEERWATGDRPQIEEFALTVADALRGHVVRELIAIDLFFRVTSGEQPRSSDYIERFPNLDGKWLETQIAAAVESRGLYDAKRKSVEGRTSAGAFHRLEGHQTRLPQQFGEYELLQEIARGGMGVVFKARQVTLNRTVAVKMILGGLLATPAEVDRFQAEAEAVARLDHPGIVPVFEIGENEGSHFFSMGYVEGRSLTACLADGPLPPTEAAQLVRTICDAVQYAHQHGVIHRDLKPANILIDTEGRPRVTDFGLAKSLLDDSGRTATGQVLGTPSFMPPEQAAGRLDSVGPAADVYSLGAVLYTLVAGRPPFQAASSVETLRQVLENDPPSPKSLNPVIPNDLETIVLKCLGKSIPERYPTAQDMGDDLQRFLDGRPILARPTGRWERAWRLCGRNPVTAGLVVAVGVLIIAIAVVSAIAAFEYRGQLHRAESAEQEALAKSWDSYVVAARAGRLSHRPGQRFTSLQAIEKALALPLPPGRSLDELRTESIASLLLPDLEAVKDFSGFRPRTTTVAIDGVFERYALGNADGKISVRRVSDDAELFQLPGEGPLAVYGGLDFSPDGRYLLQCTRSPPRDRVRVWKLDGTKPEVVLRCLVPFAFSPDSREFAGGASDESIHRFDLQTGQELKRYELGGFAANELDWNPRRPILATYDLANRTAYRLLDLKTGKLGPAVTVPAPINVMDWHPGGRLLAMSHESSPQGTIIQWDTDANRQAVSPMDSHQPLNGIVIRYSHFGDRLISTDWGGLWRVWDTRTGQLLLTQPGGITELRFSPDDHRVGLDSSPKGARYFRFESGREFCTIVHRSDSAGYQGSNIPHCQLDDDGRLLAFPVSEGFAVVDAVRGEEIAVLSPPGSVSIVAEHSGDLLTHGTAGLLRWPLAYDPKTNRRVYGPPVKLAPMMAEWPPNGIGESQDGGVLAFPAGDDGAHVLLLPRGETFPLTSRKDVRTCAVSPDGRWAATGRHEVLEGPAVEIWDVKERRCVRELPLAQFCSVMFSPNGKWLLTAGGGARLWSVGDWREGPALGKTAMPGAFSADGGLLALQDVPGVVRIVVPESGKEVARLTAPEPIRLDPLCFTRDGRRLVCRAKESGFLHIFDLGLIREELAAMRLDFEASALPTTEQRSPPPVEVQLVGADKVGYDPAH